ncbi:MAG: HdeD family acid-resistance protein [Burkholderiales bacterium]|nr:HdeD family acid-resistance protein [Burkholderiales bacterium]
MAQVNEATLANRGRAFGALEKNWGWLLALGILFIVLGVVGIGMAVTLTIASLLVFGVLLLAGGVVQLIEAFKNKGWKSVLWHVLIAILYIVGGITVLDDPILASKVLTLVLAGAILGIGIVRVAVALQHRGTAGWVWTLLGGFVSIALGVLIYLRWPISALWLIGMFVAIDLIASGWSYVFLALAARKAGSRAAA